MRELSLFGALLLFWAGLSGEFHSRWLMGVGVVCAAGVVWVVKRMGILDDETLPRRNVLRFLIYVPWLLWEIFLANVDLARRIWSRRLRIAPGMVEVPYQTGPLATVVYANSITLTPGTITVRIDDGKILVHVLTNASRQWLLSGKMHDRVRRVEGSAS